MKKLSFAQDDFADLGLLRHGPAAREADWEAPEDLAVVDLIELYLEIEAAFEEQRGVTILFVGASGGSGSSLIALDMAWAAVSILGKKLLVLNYTRAPWTLEGDPGEPPDSGHSHHPVSSEGELIKVTGHELYMADMANRRSKGPPRARNEEITARLRDFSRSFDMVVVVPPPADSDPLAAVLARCVDGSVLVIEAERTRRAAAIRLREILARAGRPIVGAVLHDRRNHIPPWLAPLV